MCIKMLQFTFHCCKSNAVDNDFVKFLMIFSNYEHFVDMAYGKPV